MNIDLKQLGADLSAQFQGLQGRHPGLWPLAPRLLCAAGAMAGVLALGWYFYWDAQFEQQDNLAQQETTLRADYRSKMAQAINLDALEAQQQQVNRYVERLEKQLPSKAEMAALLSDINQAGVGRGLTFQLFKPGQVVVRDYYAEQPIDIKVAGTYHDIGEFAADMAKMPRIVTLNNLSLNTGTNGALQLDAIAKTFRYLDPDELDAQAKARKNKKAAAKGAADAKGGKA
jgi:type IV pilus assembly protein PilO